MEGLIVGRDNIPVIPKFVNDVKRCFDEQNQTPNCDLN